MGNGPEFFQTIMGKVFYEGTMPALVRELKKLNENLAKQTEKQTVEDGHSKPNPTVPPAFLIDLALHRARENTASGDQSRVLVGDHIIDMLQALLDEEKSDQEKIQILIKGLIDIEDAAFTLRKELAGDPD